MIRLVTSHNIELVANCFVEARDGLERMAAKHGHHDPPDFVGSLALELCMKNELPPYRCTRTYIFWLAKKRLLDYDRRRGCGRTLKTITLAEDAYLPATTHNIPPRAEGDLIAQAFDSLSPKQRDILDRKHLNAESNREIALVHHMTEHGVRSALHRSKKMLRKLLPSKISEE